MNQEAPQITKRTQNVGEASPLRFHFAGPKGRPLLCSFVKTNPNISIFNPKTRIEKKQTQNCVNIVILNAVKNLILQNEPKWIPTNMKLQNKANWDTAPMKNKTKPKLIFNVKFLKINVIPYKITCCINSKHAFPIKFPHFFKKIA